MSDDPGSPSVLLGCTCPPKAPEASGSRPGRRVASGFDWHRPECPVVAGAVLSAEARERIQQRFREYDEAQRRAMEGASSYVIG